MPYSAYSVFLFYSVFSTFSHFVFPLPKQRLQQQQEQKQKLKLLQLLLVPAETVPILASCSASLPVAWLIAASLFKPSSATHTHAYTPPSPAHFWRLPHMKFTSHCEQSEASTLPAHPIYMRVCVCVCYSITCLLLHVHTRTHTLARTHTQD